MVGWVRDDDDGGRRSSWARGAWAAARTKIPSGLVAEARRRWARGGDGEVEEVQAGGIGGSWYERREFGRQPVSTWKIGIGGGRKTRGRGKERGG
jgi:hypothetical protein